MEQIGRVGNIEKEKRDTKRKRRGFSFDFWETTKLKRMVDLSWRLVSFANEHFRRISFIFFIFPLLYNFVYNIFSKFLEAAGLQNFKTVIYYTALPSLYAKKCYSSVERIFCLPIIPYSIILYITFFKIFGGRRPPEFLNCYILHNITFPFPTKMLFICRENILFPYNGI